MFLTISMVLSVFVVFAFGRRSRHVSNADSLISQAKTIVANDPDGQEDVSLTPDGDVSGDAPPLVADAFRSKDKVAYRRVRGLGMAAVAVRPNTNKAAVVVLPDDDVSPERARHDLVDAPIYRS